MFALSILFLGSSVFAMQGVSVVPNPALTGQHFHYICSTHSGSWLIALFNINGSIYGMAGPCSLTLTGGGYIKSPGVFKVEIIDLAIAPHNNFNFNQLNTIGKVKASPQYVGEGSFSVVANLSHGFSFMGGVAPSQPTKIMTGGNLLGGIALSSGATMDGVGKIGAFVVGILTIFYILWWMVKSLKKVGEK